MKKGIILTLNSGRYDWYDPVEYPDGLTEYEKDYKIDNGCHVYTIPKATVNKLEWYEICQECLHDLNGETECYICKQKEKE